MIAARTFNQTAPDPADRFHRLWRYYLLVCAGAFQARRNQLWQLVLSPSGVPGGYRREEPWVRSSLAS